MERRRAEGAERSELVWEMMQEFVWMDVAQGRRGVAGTKRKRAGGDMSRGEGETFHCVLRGLYGTRNEEENNQKAKDSRDAQKSGFCFL